MSPESLISDIERPHSLSLRFADVPVRVMTNDPEILARLASYFRPFVTTRATPLAEVSLIQGSVPVSGEFVDVVRNGGRRPKEATQEVAGGRLVLKRTNASRPSVGLGLLRRPRPMASSSAEFSTLGVSGRTAV